MRIWIMIIIVIIIMIIARFEWVEVISYPLFQVVSYTSDKSFRTHQMIKIN